MEQQKIIHIGFPKTGSTFLQKYFAAHPQIHHDRQRFNHYIRTGVVDQHLKQTDDNCLFDVLSEELLSIWPGEQSEQRLSRYNMDYDIRRKQKETAENLKSLFPDAKVLIVVRGYSSLISSLYSQYLLGGGTDSLKKIIGLLEASAIEMFDYDYTIGNYKEAFGKYNVLVMPFEWLADSPVQYLKYLEQFFGFQHLEFVSDRVHPSLNSHSVKVVRCINFLTRMYLAVIPETHRKQKFNGYLEWLYHSKGKLNSFFKLGKVLRADKLVKRREEFNQNAASVKFEEPLSKYNAFYN